MSSAERRQSKNRRSAGRVGGSTQAVLCPRGPQLGHTWRRLAAYSGHSERPHPASVRRRTRSAEYFQAGHASSILVTRSTSRKATAQGNLCGGLSRSNTPKPLAVLSACYSASVFLLSTTSLSRVAISRAGWSVTCWQSSAAAMVECPSGASARASRPHSRPRGGCPCGVGRGSGTQPGDPPPPPGRPQRTETRQLPRFGVAPFGPTKIRSRRGASAAHVLAGGAGRRPRTARPIAAIRS